MIRSMPSWQSIHLMRISGRRVKMAAIQWVSFIFLRELRMQRSNLAVWSQGGPLETTQREATVVRQQRRASLQRVSSPILMRKALSSTFLSIKLNKVSICCIWQVRQSENCSAFLSSICSSALFCRWTTLQKSSKQWQVSTLLMRSQPCFTTYAVISERETMQLRILHDCRMVGGMTTSLIALLSAPFCSVKMEQRRGQSLPLAIIYRQRRKRWRDLCLSICAISSARASCNISFQILLKSRGTVKESRVAWACRSERGRKYSLRMLEERSTTMKSNGCFRSLMSCSFVTSYITFLRFRQSAVNLSVSLFVRPSTCPMRIGFISSMSLPRERCWSSLRLSSFGRWMIFSSISKHWSGRQPTMSIFKRLLIRICILLSSRRALQLMAMVIRSRRRSHMQSSLISGLLVNCSLIQNLSSQYLASVSSYSRVSLEIKMKCLRSQGTVRRISFDIFWSKMAQRAPMKAKWCWVWFCLISVDISLDDQHVNNDDILMMMSLIIAFELQLVLTDVFEPWMMVLSSLLMMLVSSLLLRSFSVWRWLRKVNRNWRYWSQFMQCSFLLRNQQQLACFSLSSLAVSSPNSSKETVRAVQMSKATYCLQMVSGIQDSLILTSLFLLMGLEPLAKQWHWLRYFIVAPASRTIPCRISSLCSQSSLASKSITLKINVMLGWLGRVILWLLALHYMFFTRRSKKLTIRQCLEMRVNSLIFSRIPAMLSSSSSSCHNIAMHLLTYSDSSILQTS